MRAAKRCHCQGCASRPSRRASQNALSIILRTSLRTASGISQLRDALETLGVPAVGVIRDMHVLGTEGRLQQQALSGTLERAHKLNIRVWISFYSPEITIHYLSMPCGPASAPLSCLLDSGVIDLSPESM